MNYLVFLSCYSGKFVYSLIDPDYKEAAKFSNHQVASGFDLLDPDAIQ
jgi:hypothetical protein